MKLNPSDIRHQEFKRTLRGFHPAEVSAFLEVVSEDYEELMGESQVLRQKLRSVEQQLDDLRSRLQESEDTASTLKSEIEKNKALLDGQMDAELLKQKAEREASSIVEAARREAAALSKDIRILEEQKAKVAGYLRSYLRSQMALLGIIEGDQTSGNPVSVAERDQTQSVPKLQPGADDAIEKVEASGDAPVTSSPLPDDLESSNIDAFLEDVQLDDIPDDLANALRRYDDENEDEHKKRILEDLDNLSRQATGLFKKSDFHKMLGDDLHMKSEEIINRIYAALEKKKSSKDNT